MDVTLHLGAHRCASTTLQRFLQRNVTALGDAGVATWGPKRTRDGLFAGLTQRAAAVTPSIARRGMRSCGVIAIEITRLRQDGYRDLIISDENLIGSVRSNLVAQSLYSDTILRLERILAGIGPNPRRIGIAIRAYDKFWASSLAFCMARGMPAPSPNVLTALSNQARRWRDVIEDIATIFPRSELLVWPFERFAGQPEAQLGWLTGGLTIPGAAQGRRDWLNRSPNCTDLRRLLPDNANHKSLTGSGAFMPFDSGAQQRMRDAYAADLDWLRNGADGLATFLEAANPTPTTIITSAFSASDRQPMGQPQGGSTNDTEQIVV